ncbi:MAG: PIN domain-containing protein [Bryobacteraceae bacterium]|jgi:PIN domain nuclease of toxin-antitoxin system
MAAIVADTHAALWYLTDNPRLSVTAARALDEASAAGDPILIPSISLVELTYLIEKGRLPAEARRRLVDALADPEGPYELAALDARVAEAVERIDRNAVPDMPDRVIAATALARALALVSRDARIRAANLQTVW